MDAADGRGASDGRPQLIHVFGGRSVRNRGPDPKYQQRCLITVPRVPWSALIMTAAGLGSACGGPVELPPPVNITLTCEPPILLMMPAFGCDGWSETQQPLTLTLVVRPDGRLQDAWIVSASRVQGPLIERCVKQALANATFTPARDCDGHPVAGMLTKMWTIER